MKSSAYLCISAILLFFVQSSVCVAYPEYGSDESKRVVEAMVKAHGGLEKWRNAPSIRYDDIMHNPYAGKGEFAWWVAHEVIDQKTRKVWQNWPMDDAKIGYDGERVWSENWHKGNPSASMVHFFYYFVNLPWLTQDDGVILAEPTRFVWPDTNIELYEVRMTFDGAPDVGKSGKDFFVLYIHPETYRLFGYQYGNGYKPLVDLMNMPEGQEVFGPLWRRITRYEEVGGLLFPTAFHTMPEAGARIVGDHVILNIDVSTPFEDDNAAQPKEAVVFSGPLRTD